SNATSDGRITAVLFLAALVFPAGCGGGRSAAPPPEVGREAPVPASRGRSAASSPVLAREAPVPVSGGSRDSTVVDRSTAPQDTVPGAVPAVAMPASLPEPIL